MNKAKVIKKKRHAVPFLDKLAHEDPHWNELFTRWETPVTGQVYFIQGKMTRRIKIGYSDGVSHRFGTIQSHSPDDLELLVAVPGSLEWEQALHRRFAKYRIRDEWFLPADEILGCVSSFLDDQKTQEKIDAENAEDLERTKAILNRYGVVWMPGHPGTLDASFNDRPDKDAICKEIFQPCELVKKERSITVRADPLLESKEV